MGLAQGSKDYGDFPYILLCVHRGLLPLPVNILPLFSLKLSPRITYPSFWGNGRLNLGPMLQFFLFSGPQVSSLLNNSIPLGIPLGRSPISEAFLLLICPGIEGMVSARTDCLCC